MSDDIKKSLVFGSVVLLFLVVFGIFNSFGADNKGTKDEPLAHQGDEEVFAQQEANDTAIRHPGITAEVTGLDEEPVEVDGVVITPIGIEYGKNLSIHLSEGWETSDDRGLFETIAGSAEEIFEMPEDEFKKLEETTKNMDGEIIIYFEMYLKEGQRPKVPEIPMRLIDDKGAESIIRKSDKSFGHAPMSPGKKYIETLKTSVFSDVESFTLIIGDKQYKIDAPEFKWE